MGTGRYFYLLSGVAFVFFVSLASEGQAQDLDYFSLPPDQLLNAEVISASKKSERLGDTPAAVYVITQEDIQRAGVLTIPEALRLAPGVNVAQADSNSWAVSIRGFNGVFANKLLVMIDGRSVYNPLFAGTYWELQDYVLADIDRIEVVRGPGGALWGANAVNGVINIITKKASHTQGNLFTGYVGTEEKGAASFRHGGVFGDENHYRVYGKYFTRSSFERPGGSDNEDEWQGGRAGFRMDWGNDFTLQGDVYRVLTDQVNATPILVAPFSINEDEAMESNGANLLARWSKEYRDGSSLNLQSYLDYAERDQIQLDDKRGIFDVEAQYNIAPSDRNEIAIGGGYRFTHDDLDPAPNIDVDQASRSDHTFNIFVQDKITLLEDKWYLTLGSKLEHNDYTGFEIQPNARLQFHPDETQMVWTAISRAVRTPSRLEHDITQDPLVVLSPGGTVVTFFDNDDFDSEELIAYEAGYRKQFADNLSIDLAAFYNDYDELGTVGFLPSAPGTLAVEYDNGMTGETYGFEIAATWELRENFKIMASYSYLDIQLHVDESNGFALETAEEQSPQNQANLRTYWKINDNVSLDTVLYYVDELEANDVDDYVRLDLNLGWKLNENVRFNLTGQNLLDESHREFNNENSINAAEVERAVYGKVTWEF